MVAKEDTLSEVLLRSGAVVALIVTWAVLAKAQTTAYTLQHDGETRSYRLFLPADYEPGDAIPLVLNLHGRGSNGLEQALYTGMNAVADTAGFAVCYPDGLDGEWNVGWSFGSRADDLGFLARLLDTLQANFGFDASRTYACGMSNGGFMSYVLACERAGSFAAVASVTGGMLATRRARCTPERPVPVMQIHGTDDPIVRYDGFASVNEPIEDTVEGWAAINGCGATPAATDLPDTRDDGFTTERRVYGDCDGGAEVQLLVVDGGGHTWPGGAIDLGGTTDDFSASAEVWDFLSRFRRVGTSVVSDPRDRADRTDRLEVWPNPVRGGQLSLKPAARGRVFEVFDAAGRLVRRVSVAAGGSMLDLGEVAPGVYSLSEGGTAVRLTVE